jgi:hypothetical protein
LKVLPLPKVLVQLKVLSLPKVLVQLKASLINSLVHLEVVSVP